MIERHSAVGEIEVGIFQGLLGFLEIEAIAEKLGDHRRVHDPQFEMMNASRRFALLLNVDIAAVRHALLRQIEVIAFRVMGAVGGKRAVRRPLQHGDLGIFLLDAPDRLFDVVDVDAEMMQPGHVTGLAADHGDADIAVADADGVVGADRLLFFFRPRLRPLHAESGFEELGLADEVFADDGEVLDSSKHKPHKPPCGRFQVQNVQVVQPLRSVQAPSFILPATRGRKEVERDLNSLNARDSLSRRAS